MSKTIHRLAPGEPVKTITLDGVPFVRSCACSDGAGLHIEIDRFYDTEHGFAYVLSQTVYCDGCGSRFVTQI